MRSLITPLENDIYYIGAAVCVLIGIVVGIISLFKKKEQ